MVGRQKYVNDFWHFTITLILCKTTSTVVTMLDPLQFTHKRDRIIFEECHVSVVINPFTREFKILVLNILECF